MLSSLDQREQVFSHWLNVDRQRPGNSLFWSADQAINLSASKAAEAKHNYLQLSLDI